MNWRTLPILLAFLVMGIADAMGPLADAVRRQYALSQTMGTLLTFFVFIAFALFSVPAGILAARWGKKKLLLAGLTLNAAAVAVPSVITPSFGLLLGCIFLLGVGTTFLQVAGNPIVRDVCGAGAYARTLSFAQFVKGAGSSASSGLVGLVAVLPFLGAMGWRGVFPVFFVLFAITWPAVKTLDIQESRSAEPPGLLNSLTLLKEAPFLLAVIGIFLYVGAEVCMARFLKPTLVGLGLGEEKAAFLGPALFFAALTLGRLLGSAVLRKIRETTFFRFSAGLGLLGCLALVFGTRPLALAGTLAAGLGFANIWPLLFALTVERRPERGAELSGLMCMAISGGALAPLLMGMLADRGLGPLAWLVPTACFGYLMVLALASRMPTAEPRA